MTPTSTTTSSSAPRAANAAISGYAYQFDKTILEVLGADDGDSITVEGCEDIDLHSANEATAVQCKYHAAGSFSLPGIRKPLLFMLRSLAAGMDCRYRLYAHYGADASGTMPSQLTVDELKQALTEDKRKPKRQIRHYEEFDDKTLSDFVDRFSAEEGPSLEDQRSAVHSALCDALSCTAEDVADLHYADAFVLVMQAAMNPDSAQRTITRPTFVGALDKQRTMFTRWHRAFLGQERYLKAIKRQITAQGLLRSTGRRLLVLGSREMGAETETTRVADLLAGIASVGYGIGKLRTAQPWTVVLDAPDDRVHSVKTALVNQDVMLNDGFEDLSFRKTLFERSPVVNVSGSKVTRTSYDLRLMRRTTFEQQVQQLVPPTVVLTFSDHDVNLDLAGTSRHLHVAGCDVEQIADLLGAFA